MPIGTNNTKLMNATACLRKNKNGGVVMLWMWEKCIWWAIKSCDVNKTRARLYYFTDPFIFLPLTTRQKFATITKDVICLSCIFKSSIVRHIHPPPKKNKLINYTRVFSKIYMYLQRTYYILAPHNFKVSKPNIWRY